MWAVVKNWLRRVDSVRTADLQDYLNEFEVRFNSCGMDNQKLFWRMLERIRDEYKVDC